MYSAGFADVYDALYAARGKDYAAESTQVTELIRARNPRAATLLDVACGTGNHLVHLRASFRAEGVELSEPMAALARAKGLPVSVGDMRDVDLGRTFDAVTCLFSAIGYVRTLAGLRATAANLARHLSPGGVLILEPWVYREDWRGGHAHLTHATEPGRSIARMTHSGDDGHGLSTITMHFLVGTAGGVDHFVDVHELGLFSRDEYASAVADAGCRAEVLAGGLIGRGLIIGTKRS